MVELIITEKPNAAKKIAEALSDGKATKKSDNTVPYYELVHGGKDIIVGCAVGHLYGLKQKEGAKTLPIFDIEWVPTSDINKSSAFSKKYLTTLKKLAKLADTFTVATDFDIEGEVIGLNVVRYICKKKDARRMKFSTLTDEELVEAYAKASPHLEWGQAHAGEARHILDWFYGINVSRALTKAISGAGGFKLLSTGRVQGPALKLVVDKEREIKAFIPEPYWMIGLNGTVHSKALEAWHLKDKIFDKKEADKIMNTVAGAKEGKVHDIETTQFNQAPPVPFDLTSLQIEAHRCVRISPKRTLEIAQDLYTGGFISYPRTSSQQLPESIGYKKVLQGLAKSAHYKPLADSLLKKSSLRPNNGKKTDPAHPAIYPTGIVPKLDEEKHKIYDLIVHRFLATFGDPAKRQTIKATISVRDEPFIAKGTTTIEKGWHTLYGPYVDLEEEELPKMIKGDHVVITKIEQLAKETTPPKRYTESSIIKELEKRNLGTKATRAQIVDTLFQRGYIDGKAIEATELGIRTCETLEKYCPKLVDEALTRHFEEEMDQIREDKKTEQDVIEEAKVVVTDIIDMFKKQEKGMGKDLSAAHLETRNVMTTVGKCPKCAEGELGLRKGKFGMFIACNKYPDCKTTFSLPQALVKPSKNVCETCKLPKIMIIKKGKQPQEICIDPRCPSKMANVDPEKIKEMAAIDSGNVVKKCPLCKEGNLVVRKSIYGAFLGCNRYPKCRYTEKRKSE